MEKDMAGRESTKGILVPMRNRFVRLILAGTVLLAFSPVLFAQTAPQSGSDREAPDLSGMWLKEQGFGFRVVGEEPAMLPWAAERYKASREGARNPTDRATNDIDPIQYPFCMPQGFPRAYDWPHPFEIIQTPSRVTILFEVNHQVRRIYMDGRKHPEGGPPTFMGHSTGKYEGDNLVVETVGLNDLTWLDSLGRPHTDSLRVEERIRRVNHGTLEINFLFDDSKTYAKPWTGKKVFELKPDWEILEHIICEDRSGEDWRKAVDGK